MLLHEFTNVSDVVAFYKKTFPEKLRELRALPAERQTEVLDFFGMMKMPRAQFVAVDSAGHLSHLDQLDTVASAVLRFLRRSAR